LLKSTFTQVFLRRFTLYHIIIWSTKTLLLLHMYILNLLDLLEVHLQLLLRRMTYRSIRRRTLFFNFNWVVTWKTISIVCIFLPSFINLVSILDPLELFFLLKHGHRIHLTQFLLIITVTVIIMDSKWINILPQLWHLTFLIVQIGRLSFSTAAECIADLLVDI
jgi:hypothetical protein